MWDKEPELWGRP